MASSSAGGVSKGQRLSGKPNNRFSCQNMDIEWTLTDSDGINCVVSQLLFNAASWSEMNQSISKLQRELSNYSNISPVYPLLQQALRTKDPNMSLHRIWVILSAQCLSNTTNDTSSNDWPMYFVGPIFDDIFSKKLPRYQFHGKTYRGARISQSELDTYVAGRLIFNKGFTSTSKQLDVAKRLIYPPANQKPDK
ncbi:unnamed protein product [Rotaria socialis]|uniref:Uncharacterized protein n=2 Tax=Rotaria socialis TaxID=392032 RepID=A0A818UG16_9BILA|nr:unnamed protein product [Rotaria socialis]CAF4613175.1 unnamed protein product [Rotaria socialis]